MVERLVLLGNHGRTGGSIFKVTLGFEVRLVRQNNGMSIDFSLRNGFCK